ncbi:hypothetical protein [Methylobacter tundripaludum]
MTEKHFSSDTNHQRAVLLAWLQSSIITYWTTADTGKAKHRVACYALLSKV